MRRFCAVCLSLSAFVLLAAGAAPAEDTCTDAELILRGGKIVTMDAAGRIAQALAVRDGRILAVGSDDEINRCAGAHTEVIDLAGRTVLPGLIDVHTHALDWAKSILRGELDLRYPAVRAIGDIVRLVGERVAATPEGAWVIGSGWDDAQLAERRYPTRRDLDAVSPRHPVYLVHISGHLAAANSAALARAGITRETPEPAGGVIERDAAGEPTGIVKDTAMALVARHLPADPPDLALRAAKLVSEKALEVGLTTIHDIYLSPDDMRAYQEARRRGWLKVRVQMVPGVGSLKDAEEVIRMGVHTGFGDEQLKLGAVKVFADGGMGARTIAIYPPGVAGEPAAAGRPRHSTLAGRPENVGLLIWKTEELQQAHRLLAAAGWQITTHAIGDRAMDQVLDSYAATIKALNLDAPRFRIAHGGLSTPAIQKRLRALGVLVETNPAFVYWIGSWFEKYGPERVRWAYPGKSYVENGIIAAGASDVGVTPLSPWWGIWAAVVRREMRSGKVLAPEERLTVLEALRLYTRNAGYLGFEEAVKGSLEPGQLADFIVVDRDVLAVPPDQLKDVRVLMTFLSGHLAFERPQPTAFTTRVKPTD